MPGCPAGMSLYRKARTVVYLTRKSPVTFPAASAWGLATLPWLASPDGEQARCRPARSYSYLLYVVDTEIYL